MGLTFFSTASAETEKAGTFVSGSRRSGILRKETRVPVVYGQDFLVGDRIKTDKDSSLKLLFRDRTIVDLGAETVFDVQQFNLRSTEDRTVTLSTDQGLIRTSVNRKVKEPGKFTFRTRTSTMGVRGTEFLIQAPKIESGVPPADEKIVVLSGAVQVASPSTNQPNVILKSGEQLSLAPTPPADMPGAVTGDSRLPAQTSAPTTSRVETLSGDKMEQARSESTVKDQTFMRSVEMKTDGQGSSRGGRDALAIVGQTMQQGDFHSLGTVDLKLFLPPSLTENHFEHHEETNSATADIHVNFIR